jgi:hypothetical protein
VVDAPDYVIWRKMRGQTAEGLAADGNVNGTVDDPDFYVWRSQFGKPPGSGAGASLSAAVPEPTAMSLLLIALVLGPMAVRNRWKVGPVAGPPK